MTPAYRFSVRIGASINTEHLAVDKWVRYFSDSIPDFCSIRDYFIYITGAPDLALESSIYVVQR